jgi:hypothetical protein
MQGELRAHTRSLDALRETQLEHGAAIRGHSAAIRELRGDVSGLRGERCAKGSPSSQSGKRRSLSC